MSLWNVPLADIDLGDEIRAVTDVLRSKWLSMGPVTAEFERQFAAMVGVKHAFAVTAARQRCTWHLALGAGPGDTVICPSLTFVATANAIRYTGATPVFADVTSVENCNISPEVLRPVLTQPPRASAWCITVAIPVTWTASWRWRGGMGCM